MSRKDRARTREQPKKHNRTTVVPFSSLLGILAKRVDIGRAVPSPSPTPNPTLPVQTLSPPTQPTSTSRPSEAPSGLTGRGAGLVAQDVVRWYQKTQSWRKVAHWMHTPLAELRAWAHVHANDLGILGSDALQALLRPVPVPRVHGRRTLINAPSNHVSQTRAFVRSVHSEQTMSSVPTAQAAMKPSMHWSGMNLTNDVTEVIARYCRERLLSEEDFFHDVFDASKLSATADEIGIGSGILEGLIKAANGLLVNHSVFTVLGVRRGKRSVTTYLEDTFDPERIDTIAQEHNMSAHQYMQLIQQFCPALLQGAATET